MRPRLSCRPRNPYALRLVLSPVIFLLVSACGYQEDSPPVLTAIRYQSPAYQAGFNQGEAALTGAVDFEDPDGDLVLLHVRWQNCGTGPLMVLDSLQENSGNPTSGTIFFIIFISTDCPLGTYKVRVSSSDGQGNRSNVLEAVYEIYSPE